MRLPATVLLAETHSNPQRPIGNPPHLIAASSAWLSSESALLLSPRCCCCCCTCSNRSLLTCRAAALMSGSATRGGAGLPDWCKRVWQAATAGAASHAHAESVRLSSLPHSQPTNPPAPPKTISCLPAWPRQGSTSRSRAAVCGISCLGASCTSVCSHLHTTVGTQAAGQQGTWPRVHSCPQNNRSASCTHLETQANQPRQPSTPERGELRRLILPPLLQLLCQDEGQAAHISAAAAGLHLQQKLLHRDRA